MLRLDVERLKGELSVARLATRAAQVRSGEVVLTVGAARDTRETTEVLRNVTVRRGGVVKMPADATCGGPGRCGRIGCGHPGWGH